MQNPPREILKIFKKPQNQNHMAKRSKTAKCVEEAYTKWWASPGKEYTIPYMIGYFGDKFKRGGKISAEEFAQALENSVTINTKTTA